MSRALSLRLDERQWSWLRDHGDPAALLVTLLDRAIRDDVLKRALRDERAVELLIRRHEKHLSRRFGADGTTWDLRQSLRALAEEEILGTCASMQDAAMRAAAGRVGLRLRIERRHIEDPAAAKVLLQREREQRPGAWREVLTERPA